MHPIALRLLSFVFLIATTLGAAAQSRLWFVDNARTDGDGSLAAPFPTIGAATAAAGAGDVIYLFRGRAPYREHVLLGERQLLVGHGSDFAADAKSRNITVPSGLPDLAVAPVIDGGEGDALTLVSGSTVINVQARTTSGRAIVIANADGEVTVRAAYVETISGVAVAVEGGNADLHFVRSPVHATTGAAIAIRKRTGGSVKFDAESTITIDAGARDAFVLEGNQGEHTFTGGLRITTNGARAIVVRSSSQVALTSADSTVATTKATAVDVADTGISIVLRSATVDGAGADVKRGISIENAPGSFRIAGGAVRNIAARGISIVKASGVALQNLVIEDNAASVKSTTPCATLTSEKTLDCAAAIYLADATDVSISNTRVDDSGHTAIFGDGVTNLTIDGATIEDAGDEPGEHGIAIRQLLGKSVISNSTIRDSAARQLYIANRSGEGSLELRKTRLDGGPPPAGQQGVAIELDGDAKFSIAVSDSDFTEHFSDGIAVVAAGKSKAEAFVHGSRFASTASAISIITDADASLDYRITQNEIRGATGPAISLHTRNTSGTERGTIAENTIGAKGVAGSGAKCGTCAGISVLATRGGKLESTIRANVIRQVDGYGIRVNARGTAMLAAAITGNAIEEPHGADAISAIALQSGALKADTARLCADVSANRISGAWGIATSVRGSGTVALAGLTGDPTEFLRAKNSGANVTVAGTPAVAASCF